MEAKRRNTWASSTADTGHHVETKQRLTLHYIDAAKLMSHTTETEVKRINAMFSKEPSNSLKCTTVTYHE